MPSRVSNQTKVGTDLYVVIGIDPHKASHTAVAIDEAEDELSSVKIRATWKPLQVDPADRMG